MRYRDISLKGFFVFLGVVLGACSWLPGGNLLAQPKTSVQTASTISTPVEIISAGLLASPSGDQFELGVTLANRADKTLWVRVYFHSPDGLSDCVVAKEMEQDASSLFVCPQAVVLSGVDYPVDIAAFFDIEQLIEAGRLTTDLRFE